MEKDKKERSPERALDTIQTPEPPQIKDPSKLPARRKNPDRKRKKQFK